MYRKMDIQKDIYIDLQISDGYIIHYTYIVGQIQIWIDKQIEIRIDKQNYIQIDIEIKIYIQGGPNESL